MRIIIACGLDSRADYNCVWIIIACGLDSRSRAGFWKNDGAAVRVVRTKQYNNLSRKKREDCIINFRKSSFLGSSEFPS